MKKNFTKATLILRVVILVGALIGVFFTMRKLQEMQQVPQIPQGKVSPVLPSTPSQ